MIGKVFERLLKSNTSSLVGYQMATNLASIAMVPFLSRALGPSSWGVVILAQTIILLLAPVIEYGFSYSSSREIVKHNKEEGKIKETIWVTFFSQLFLVITVSVIFILISIIIPHSGGDRPIYLFALLYGFSNALLPWYFYMAMNKIKNLAYTSIASRILPVFFVVFLIRDPNDAWMFFLILLIPNLINLVYHYLKIKSEYPVEFPDFYTIVFNIRNKYSVFLSRYLRQIKQPAMSFILGIHVSPAEFSFFGGASKIHKVIDAATEPFNKVLFPKFVKKVNQNSSIAREEIRKLILLQLLVIGALVGVIVIFADPIIFFFLGEDYMEASTILKLMLFALPIQIANRLYSHLWLFANELESYFLKAMIPILIITLGVSVIVAKEFGSLGICTLIILSELVISISMLLIARKRIKTSEIDRY